LPDDSPARVAAVAVDVRRAPRRVQRLRRLGTRRPQSSFSAGEDDAFRLRKRLAGGRARARDARRREAGVD
jgi:hypothetical protein